ncbi:splicing factor, proline- and glutamine-rich-like, partial [Alexandromys fortis]|uniref:splicing factor, proline- and glutamine-rich-like n=1 Tax=Alexandromys fortis TaxID=100897 RepID=UPI002153019B
ASGPLEPGAAGGRGDEGCRGGREGAGRAGGPRRWSGRRRQREEGGGGRAAARGGGGGGDSTWESDIGYKFNSSPENTARAGGRVQLPGRGAERTRPETPDSGLASGTRQPPPRPLLPPTRGCRRSFLPPPPRGLLLTLRKTPDVRGWLSATGGSGFPAPRPLLAASAPRPNRAPVPRLPRAPQTRGDPRPSASSRENTSPSSPRCGAAVPAAGKFWVSPGQGGPRRGARGPGHPPRWDAAGSAGPG